MLDDRGCILKKCISKKSVLKIESTIIILKIYSKTKNKKTRDQNIANDEKICSNLLI